MTDFPWSDYKPTRTDPAAEYEAARREFDERRYVPAAERLEWILEQPMDHRHGLGDVRELLARSYYHSARLKPAEEAARAILADDPTHAYAALLLGRVLQRQGRADEAKAPLALAAALGREPEELDAVEIQDVETTAADPEAE